MILRATRWVTSAALSGAGDSGLPEKILTWGSVTVVMNS